MEMGSGKGKVIGFAWNGFSGRINLFGMKREVKIGRERKVSKITNGPQLLMRSAHGSKSAFDDSLTVSLSFRIMGRNQSM